MRHSTIISPSLLSANLACLGDDAAQVLAAGADWLHLDVMDNHYVPNLTFGPYVCKALRQYGISGIIDVHLMIKPVDNMIEPFAKAGASYISFHPDTTDDVHATIELIKRNNCKVGIVFNPEVDLQLLPQLRDQLDLVLLMSVKPGFGGQKFMPEVLDKARAARQIIDQWQKVPRLQIDGGINLETIGMAAQSGIDTFVAGVIFRQPESEYGKFIKQLRDVVNNKT